MSLTVAIAHYHLQPAGVTRVIENAVQALEANGAQVVVLTGRPYERGLIRNAVVIPELAYNARTNPRALVVALRHAAKKNLGKLPDLWHFHNHSLGKNAALPEAIAFLAKEKTPILLQIHDFAEDGRPANYKFLKRSLPILYPQASHIHYAVLNGRDYRFLKLAGIAKERLHHIPNAVVAPSQTMSFDPTGLLKKLCADSLILYPTRGIRRKNLGELFLWSALSKQGEHFATTLTPENAEEQAQHEAWVQYGKEQGLPLTLDICANHRLSFQESLQAADLTVTTSIAEGFGLAFLEPWLFGKPLSGRNLPEITSDFTSEGLNLTGLYERLDVPLELVGNTALQRKLECVLENYYRTYEQALPDNACETAFNTIVNEGCVDFGRLDESFQRIVLNRIVESRELASGITPQLLHKPPASCLKENQQAVHQHFGLNAYAQHLGNVYHALIESSPSTVNFLKPEAILRHFLDPKRFCLLRC